MKKKKGDRKRLRKKYGNRLEEGKIKEEEKREKKAVCMCVYVCMCVCVLYLCYASICVCVCDLKGQLMEIEKRE